MSWTLITCSPMSLHIYWHRLITLSGASIGYSQQKRRATLGGKCCSFPIAFGMAYCAQFLFLIGLVEGLNCNEYLAQFLGLFVYGGVNFLMNKKVTLNRALFPSELACFYSPCFCEFFSYRIQTNPQSKKRFVNPS